MSYEVESINDRIDALEASIAQARVEFSDRLAQLEAELLALRSTVKIQVKANTITSEQPRPVVSPTHMEKTTSSAADSLWDVELPNDKYSIAQAGEMAGPAGKDRNPIFSNTIFTGFLQVLLAFIIARLSFVAEPLQALFDKLLKLYSHYQQQGKAPVFLMTIAGLVTLSFGFGYLLQFAFSNYFSDGLKALSGLLLGVAIVAVGVFLSLRKTGFREYAASVIALGIIFNYLTAYFIGPYYGIVSEPVGMTLLALITLASFALALVFETRIVAAVTLAGGVFMPFVAGDVAAASLVFVAYLLLLSVANLYLSHRIKWPVLSRAVFFFTLPVIEYLGLSEAIYPLAAIALLSAFFYLYTYYWSFEGSDLKPNLSRYDLSILVANLFYFIYAMLQVSTDGTMLAMVLVFHAALLSLLVKYLQLMKSAQAPIYLLMIGLLFAAAVFVLAPADITSIVWAIEGLALVYIGYSYGHKLIRAEGYVIYLVAMMAMVWQAVEDFNALSPASVDWYWIHLAAFGALSGSAYRLAYRFKDSATPTECRLAPLQNELFSLWGALALSLLVVMFLPEVMLPLAVIPMLWSFYRVARHSLIFMQLVGFLFFLAFIAQIIMSVLGSQSLLISLQSWLGWLASIELMLMAWGLRYFYRRYPLEGRGQIFALKIHEDIYFLPLGLLVLAIFNLFDNPSAATEGFAFGYPWLDFIIIGAVLALAHISLDYPRREDGVSADSRQLYLIRETASLYASVFFLYTIFLLWGDWMFAAAAIPMLSLLYRGLKLGLPWTERLAWAHFVLFIVLTMQAYQTVGNFHFSEQSPLTQLVWLEALLLAWAMQTVYRRLGSQRVAAVWASRLRVAVYLLIPLLFLPRVLRLYEEYLALALWGSFAISWLMYKRLKIDPLLKELSLLFFIAFIATVAASLNAVTGGSELPGLLALAAGVVMVSLFNALEKTLSKPTIRGSEYFSLQLASPYFYGFVVAALSYAVLHQALFSLLLSGLFLVILLHSRRRLLGVMRDSLSLAYLMAWLSLTLVPLLVFTLPGQAAWVALYNLIALAALYLLTHHQSVVFRLCQRKYAGRTLQLWAFHGMVLLAYSGALNVLLEPWGVATTIAMLTHAVLILFITLDQRFKHLLRLSIALYALTAFKVLLYDMNDFGVLHKVIALMGIGSILMFAAFMFQRLRNKQLA